MNAQDLIETIAAYSNIDAPNLKIIQFDIDYIIRPEHQSIIEQVLLTAKQGHEPMVVEQYTYEMKKEHYARFSGERSKNRQRLGITM